MGGLRIGTLGLCVALLIAAQTSAEPATKAKSSAPRAAVQRTASAGGAQQSARPAANIAKLAPARRKVTPTVNPFDDSTNEPVRASRAGSAMQAEPSETSAHSGEADRVKPASASSPLPVTRGIPPRVTRAQAIEAPQMAPAELPPPRSAAPITRGAPPQIVEDQGVFYEDAGPMPQHDRPPTVRHRALGWNVTSMQPKYHVGDLQGPTPGPAHDDGPVVYEDEFDPFANEGPCCEDGSCGQCASCGPQRRWGLTGGIEALIIKPHFSEARALEATTATQPSSTSLIEIDDIPYNLDYQGSVRGYLGIRNCLCGDEFRFSYWNFDAANTVGAVADLTTNYCDFNCNLTADPGDRISASMRLNVNVFDFDLIKPFYLGDVPCDPCGPQCPVWDLRWLMGFRFADIDHDNNSLIVTANGTTAGWANLTARFSGFGPRVGIWGRRYLGEGKWSIYGKGAGSLLVGDYKQRLENFNVTPLPTQTNSTATFDRVIPVAEIEVGASWRISPRLVLSGGWLVQSWWDLGMQEIVNGEDDSNILGFDGFFARAEMVF